MKIRQGFVSNSSSSSFVVIGTRMKDKELAKLGWFEKTEDGWYEETDNIPDNIDVLYDEEDYIVGLSVVEGDDYLENTELDFGELREQFNRVSDLLGGVPVKLLVGTRAC